ncbi:MAG TPA: NUDIX hydrolase [candidate division Zixibacteria bacterium]
MKQKEFANLLESMKTGKNCDVTLFIFKDNKIVAIAKPWYQEGLYRAPSGRPKLNENLMDAIHREALEETGAKIRLKRYILRISVIFQHNRQKVNWTSHVFLADYFSGNLEPIDKREIKKVNLLTLDELASLKGKLLKQKSGGLAYRATLTEETIKIIKTMG